MLPLFTSCWDHFAMEMFVSMVYSKRIWHYLFFTAYSTAMQEGLPAATASPVFTSSLTSYSSASSTPTHLPLSPLHPFLCHTLHHHHRRHLPKAERFWFLEVVAKRGILWYGLIDYIGLCLCIEADNRRSWWRNTHMYNALSCCLPSWKIKLDIDTVTFSVVRITTDPLRDPFTSVTTKHTNIVTTGGSESGTGMPQVFRVHCGDIGWWLSNCAWFQSLFYAMWLMRFLL